MLSPNVQGDGIWSRGLWEAIRYEGTALMNGISALIKENAISQ